MTLSGAARADYLVRWLREYARTRLDVHEHHSLCRIPITMCGDFAAQGLFGLTLPIDSGGLGLCSMDAHGELGQIQSRIVERTRQS